MNNEILPLPWRVIKDYANESNRADIWTSGHGSVMVAECRTGGMRDYLQMQATADFIVMACNSHHDLKDLNAELLKALKDITETLESCVGGSDPLHYEDVKDEIEKAESVIKKATKQKPI